MVVGLTGRGKRLRVAGMKSVFVPMLGVGLILLGAVGVGVAQTNPLPQPFPLLTKPLPPGALSPREGALSAAMPKPAGAPMHFGAPLQRGQIPSFIALPNIPPPDGRTLYNAVVLPKEFPPTNEFVFGEPMVVPYLLNPPRVIPIDAGRQLFVDDFLIDSTTLTRTYHRPELYSNNPVLRPEQAWETAGKAPMAMPFSDGVWVEPWLLPVPTNITVAEVENLGLIVRRLAEGTNAIEKAWWAKLSPATRVKLEPFAGTNPPPDTAVANAARAALAAEFTEWINGPSLFDPVVFGTVFLGDQTQAWLRQLPVSRGGGFVESPSQPFFVPMVGHKWPVTVVDRRVNRLLLGDVLAREFPRRPLAMRAWYMAGYGRGTALATSTNGLDWVKPEFDVQPGSNLVQADPRDSSTVWLDHTEADPRKRYKMFRTARTNNQWGLALHFSEDGIHWGPEVLRTGPTGDRTTVFFNPFKQSWVYSLRSDVKGARTRSYWEVRDLLAGPQWTTTAETPLWVGADKLDPQRADLQVVPQLYNLDAFPYESLMVGLFTIWRGDKNIPAGRPKPNEICVGFSRDGYHWSRPDRRPFIAVSEKPGDWNWGNVQSVGGGCVVVGRKLHFYFSGRAGVEGKRDAGGATGVAFLRRDGFASMDAAAGTNGVLTTRPVVFSGRYLFCNLRTNSPAGAMQIEILDEAGAVLPGFERKNSLPMSADTTLMLANWNGKKSLLELIGRPVRFRFHLTDASLFSFWMSQPLSGASLGYMAAGGAHFPGPMDVIGNRSYSPF